MDITIELNDGYTPHNYHPLTIINHFCSHIYTSNISPYIEWFGYKHWTQIYTSRHARGKSMQWNYDWFHIFGVFLPKIRQTYLFPRRKKKCKKCLSRRFFGSVINMILIDFIVLRIKGNGSTNINHSKKFGIFRGIVAVFYSQFLPFICCQKQFENSSMYFSLSYSIIRLNYRLSPVFFTQFRSGHLAKYIWFCYIFIHLLFVFFFHHSIHSIWCECKLILKLSINTSWFCKV